MAEAAPAISRADLEKCIHCGLCTSHCPTYLELGSELDSPRGRIHLMRSAAEGRIAWTGEVVRHLDLCLECRACETACPSGVPYAKLLEAAREEIARVHRRPWRERLILRVLRDGLLPYPGRLRLALLPLRLTGGLGRRAARLLSSDLGRMAGLVGELPRPARRYTLPAVVPAEGERRYRVALLTGCVGSVLFARVNWATAQVLAANGCEVVIPPGQACCGALHLHSGALKEARAFARRNFEAFHPADFDAIITNAAGCGSTLKEYGELFRGETEAGVAEVFSGKAVDVSAFLSEAGLVAARRSVRWRVAYHDACHLAHGQGVRSEPRKLLRAIPGLELLELEESEVCCGSAGLYNLLQPEMAERLLQRKVGHILRTGAQAVATGNPGCLMQIAKGLRDRGIDLPVLHPVEILAVAYGKLEENEVAGRGGNAQ